LLRTKKEPVRTSSKYLPYSFVYQLTLATVLYLKQGCSGFSEFQVNLTQGQIIVLKNRFVWNGDFAGREREYQAASISVQRFKAHPKRRFA